MDLLSAVSPVSPRGLCAAVSLGKFLPLGTRTSSAQTFLSRPRPRGRGEATSGTRGTTSREGDERDKPVMPQGPFGAEAGAAGLDACLTFPDVARGLGDEK